MYVVRTHTQTFASLLKEFVAPQPQSPSLGPSLDSMLGLAIWELRHGYPVCPGDATLNQMALQMQRPNPAPI